MKHVQLIRMLALGGIGTLLALPALAQESYTYFGLSAGQSRAKIDDTGLAQALPGTGLRVTSISRDEKDTAYKIFGGYQFNRAMALELGYFNLGKFGFGVNTVPAGTMATQLAVQGANLDLVGTLPLSESWALLGRIGAHYAKTRANFSGTGAVSVRNSEASKRETNGKLGLGLQYAFSPSFLMRAEAERYRVSDAMGGHGNVNVASISLVFPLGRAEMPAPRVAAAPAYVAPVYVAPMPAPVVVQVAPAPVVVAPAAPVAPMPSSRRVSFSAESLFGFDQSAMRADGMAALDAFARETAGTRFDSINVEGHTDRLGSTAYNQSLSERRAESVKAYLVSNGRMESAKVSAVGKGESNPVTKPEDCKGNRQSAQLIACLQPDRRVDVVVSGTR